MPFIPAVQEARRVVETGAIGEVFRVKACEGIGTPHSRWHYDRARAGGGAMIDMAVHSIESAAAVLAMLPMFVIGLLIQRFLVRWLAMGAVKG